MVEDPPDDEMGFRCVEGSAQEDPQRTLLETGGISPDPNTSDLKCDGAAGRIFIVSSMFYFI